MADALDKNGIKNIYFTRQGGREYFMGDIPYENDPQLRLSGPLRILVDNYYQFVDPSAARLSVSTPTYQAGPTNTNHATAVARGWMTSPSDWGDGIEFTVFFNALVVIPNANPFHMMGPTGEHFVNTQDCTGSAYGCSMLFYANPPAVQIFKEQYHEQFVYSTPRTIPSFNFEFNGHGDIGSKLIVFLRYGPDKNFVKIEHWMNGNGDKVTWIKVNELTDTGGYGTLGGNCGGAPDQILNFRNGRMRFYFNWTETDFKFKYVSVREVTVDPNEIPSQPPIVIPPPQQGVFRRIYNIIYDMGVYIGMGCSADLPTPPVEGEESHEIYLVSQNGGDDTNLNETCHRQAICAETAASRLIGEKPVEVTWRLRKAGSPPSDQPITSHIRRGTDDQIVVTFDYTGGTLTPNLLSPTTYDQYTFRNTNANYSIQEDDKITVEWTGCVDANDFVRVAENTLNPFDGTNTLKRKFDAGGTPPTSWGGTQDYRDLAAQVKAKGPA